MNVTVLGTGIMGSGMARNLADAGMHVTAWNRTADKARPLTDAGIAVEEDVATAVDGADVVLTMLFDADAVAAVAEQALPAFGSQTIWVQSATVGVDGIERLAALADQHGAAFVDAPVLGSKSAADGGTLVVLAAGPERLREKLSPLFDAIGSRTMWLGDTVGDAQRLKMVVQSWTLSVTTATAQAVALASALGLDPQLFLDAIDGSAMDSKYAHLKGAAIMSESFNPDFAVDGALKDSELVLETMLAAGTNDAVMDAVRRQFAAASDAGHGAEDMAAVVHAFRP
jgi:3-hydroxyisobutyrate dehydrogenase